MHPTLFHLGPIAIQSYGFMMMMGFLVSIQLAARRARRCGADEEMVINVGLLSLITGVVGARLFYVIHYPDHFNSFFSYFALWAGGLEFYGGFLAAVAATLIYLRLKKKSIRWYLDILAPAIMLGLAFGRIGCFLNGCCWGKPTSTPVAVRFPYGSPAFAQQWLTHRIEVPGEFILSSEGSNSLISRETMAMSDQDLSRTMDQSNPLALIGGCQRESPQYLTLVKAHLEAYQTNLNGLHELIKTLDLKTVPVHPTQLYESLAALAISIVLGRYFWHRRRHGMVIVMLFIIYPVCRFLIELVREDNPHDTLGFTVSQGISLLVVPIVILFWLYLRRLPEMSPRAAAELESRARQSPKASGS